MHIPSTLTTLTTIFSLTSAFVIDIYDSENCSGNSREVNVWDNTCATWQGGFRSYKPKVYGGSHQWVWFFIPGNCGDLTSAWGRGYVDGGDAGFKIGECRSFGSGRVMNAIASYRS
ncbi:hypothetical protein B0J11DRAFT_542671 [Dendryphion nanum]|uniref:Uncharacterized protein n=1 Tax=Dendryphion nanum TaxID=256645 RepID=A0A9P9D475_9PLEO|nr:hypothetical protein B0J11DRAFT_542671 [Dendryphion nanum]